MLANLYSWTMRLAQGPRALLALIAISFAESSFFPIPPDTLLIPMVLAQRQRAFTLALWCVAASVAGGIVGYGIGALLYDSVGKWIMNLYGYGDRIEQFRETYAEWGAWDYPAERADADPRASQRPSRAGSRVIISASLSSYRSSRAACGSSLSPGCSISMANRSAISSNAVWGR